MDVSPDQPAGFNQLGLAPAVLQAVQELGYEVPTPIQLQCVPHLLAGRDLLGQAQTGTGKTAAFALPLLSRVDLNSSAPQVLVLAPTRELALQVAEAFQTYARHLPKFHVLPIYGGQSYSIQIRQLQRGAQVIVGTPGRVMDHMRRGTLDLSGIRALVLDEADEMLNMGFAEDIEWIFEQAPEQRQVALFSATMPKLIRKVAQTHLHDPVEIKVAARSETVDTIDQSYCIVTPHHKLDVLTRVLEIEPIDAMLVFVRTKNSTLELAEKLVAHGFSAEALNGDMTQQARERTVERLKNGRLDILVATDVAARGLDVPRISHVVNYDIPTDPESYVHRIGRTGRAGRKGRALLFVHPRERRLLFAIEKTIRQKISELQPPSANALSERRIERFSEELREALGSQDLDFFYQLVNRLAKDHELDVMDIAAALAYLQQRERPLEVREAPVPQRRPREREPRHDAGRERGQREARGDRRASDRPPRPEFDRAPRERKPRPTGDERPARREREPRVARENDVPWVHYRIEVGYRDGVSPREIVGAIANEAGLEGRHIGRIEIEDDHSTVDLPDGMPKDLEQYLRKVIVCGRPLNLCRAQTGDASPRRAYAARSPEAGPRDGDKPLRKRPVSNDRSAPRKKARAEGEAPRAAAPRDPRDPRQSFKRAKPAANKGKRKQLKPKRSPGS